MIIDNQVKTERHTKSSAKIKSRGIKLATMVSIMAALQGCNQEQQFTPQKPLTVTTIELAEPVAHQNRSFKGVVVPADLTPLSFRVSGELKTILVHEGQKVKKGQLLAQLDSRKIEQQLNDASVQFQLAVKQQQRGRDLLSNKMVSQSEYDELKANRQLMEYQYQAAKDQLKYTKLVAPFDGYISTVAKKSFESVGPAEEIVSVYRNDVVRVLIGVSDTVLAMLDPSNASSQYKVNTQFSGDPRQFVTSYYEHSSEPAPNSKAFEIILQMPQVEPEILPGTSASLDVDLPALQQLFTQSYQVPMTALDAGRKDNEFYLWKVVNSQTVKVPVQVTQINNDGAVVIGNINAQDIIVTSNLRRLRDNGVVAIASEE